MSKKSRLRIVFLAGAALALTGCPAEPAEDAAPAELEVVRAVQSVDSVGFLPVYAAQTQGFYEEEGLEVDVTVAGVGGPEIDALMSGEVGVSLSSGAELAKVAARGEAVIAVQSMGIENTLVLLGHPDVVAEAGFSDDWPLEQRLALLDGSTIGMSSPGALSDVLARYWVQSADLDPEIDVQIVGAGPPAGGLAALEAGDLDFLVSWPPFSELAVRDGIGEYFIDSRVGDDPSLDPWLEQTIVTTAEFAEANADLMTRLARATTRGNQWVLEHSAEEVTNMLLSIEGFEGLDPDALETSVGIVQPSFSSDGRVEAAQVDNIQRVLLLAGIIDQELDSDRYIDNSYLE